ncbi:MAG: hypothetical protein WA687_04535 [Solirubrobacterales bacterium]
MTDLKHASKHLTFANVISCIALFLALGGAAVAAKTTLAPKAVKTKNLTNGAVTTMKLRNWAVTTAKLRPLAVSTPKLANASVTAEKLANGAVRSVALGGGVVTTGKLKDGAVATDKLANGAVLSSKLSADAVATGKIQDGAVTAAKLAPSFLAQLVKGVSYVPGSSPSNTTEATKTATAACPAGKQVVGGGAKVVGGDVLIVLTESAPAPVDAAGKRTGWTAVAREATASTVAWSVEAHAICAEF